MSYSDEVVKQKISALNETQDSIVSTAQWLMFHRRHAKRTAELWLQKIKDPATNAAKKVNLLYLANEIVQQSKARKKEDFLNAFSPLVGEAIAVAYKGAPSDVQNKLKRVTEVWRQRQIFDQPTQEAIEAHIVEADKSRPQAPRKALGGALFPTDAAHSTPAEFQPLVSLQQSLSKAQLAIRPALDPANKAYTALTSGTASLPSAPLYAGRLSSLAKDLVKAEHAVAETLKTRMQLITALEKLLQSNRRFITEEEEQLAGIRTRRSEVESKKRDVDDAIMRGISTSEELNDSTRDHADFHLGQRPEIERFTPPPPSPIPAHASLPPPMEAPPFAHEEAVSHFTAPDLQRSTTPPGMPPPPSYQNGRGHNGSFFQGDGTTTPEEVPPADDQDVYGNAAADAFLESLTPPPAPAPALAPAAFDFEPPSYLTSYASTAPTNGATPSYLPGLPGLMTAPSTNGTSSLDPRKRPSSTVAASLDPRYRQGSSSAGSPTKRRRMSDDEFAVLPGMGGEGGLEGLDKDVVGMLGS